MIRWFRKSRTTLEATLGYRFTNRELLRQAVTHPSYRAEHPDADNDNQRLEFLGDAVLGLLTAEWLYARFPSKPEGELTRMRSALTSGQTLCDVGREASIGSHLLAGRGEAASGGLDRPSNITDAVEALIGAAWLDGGMRAAEAVFETLFADRLRRVGRDVKQINPKGTLQEYAQKHWNMPPAYTVSAETGPSHQRTYTVTVRLPDGREAAGHGSGKRTAEASAAEAMLAQLDDTA